MNREPDQRARNRRWIVCTRLTIVGVLVVIAGIVIQYDAATYGGIAIILIFGLFAAGARKAEAEVGPVRVKAEFDAPPPPEATRRIYLPKGWRPKKPR